MKHKALQSLLLAIAFVVTLGVATACSDKDDISKTWDEYEVWRKANDEFFNTKRLSILPNGQPEYESLIPEWNGTAQVLIRYLNDRSKTIGNLSPLYNSTVDVKYIGRLYNGTAFDSSYLQTQYGDSIFRTAVNSVVPGWTIALQNMRCGDSVEVVIPYTLGYGSQVTGAIYPYSTLVFNIKLVDIPYYEVRP